MSLCCVCNMLIPRSDKGEGFEVTYLIILSDLGKSGKAIKKVLVDAQHSYYVINSTYQILPDITSLSRRLTKHCPGPSL